MNPSDNLTRATQVTEELNKVLKLFDITKNNAKVTTSDGRIYKVANVVDFKKNDTWKVTMDVSKGMFACDECGSESKPKYFPTDAWTQIIHNDDVVRMHSSLIHRFREHPAKVPSETLEKIAKVFLG